MKILASVCSALFKSKKLSSKIEDYVPQSFFASDQHFNLPKEAMAEAAGLAIGGIALASLFSSCVEFLEYFENGRDWLYDFSLALTKVNLMKVRLYKLEYNRRIAETSLEGRDVLQIKLQQENGAISHGLSGITEILEKTTELCRKYSYNATTNDIHKAPINETRDCINHTALSFTQPRSKPKSLSIISKKVAWTLHDKKKFDGLISDFEFILSNLERIDDGQAIDKYSKEGSPKEGISKLHHNKSRLDKIIDHN